MNIGKLISLDREEITETEKRLFCIDLKKIAEEYFETDGDINVDVTRTDDGFSVCVLFGARRIKNVKRPL